MKDKEIKLEEIETSHTLCYTRCCGGRSCPGERESGEGAHCYSTAE